MKKIILISLLILQGCATAPPIQFYSLEAVKQIPPPPLQKGGISKPLIGVAQISLPSELERKQIVTRDTNGTLHFAEQHQWAALLKQNMTEVLAKNLATQQPEFWFKSYPWSLLGMVDYRLVIDVTRLEIVLGKAISFSADWTILNEKTHAVLKHDSMDLQQPLADETYATAIDGLNQLLVKMTAQLAIKL
jgi:uncharacterized lipoprotein YmbA